LKDKILFIVTFAIGLGVGALGHYEYETWTPKDDWETNYDEAGIHQRMIVFQHALEDLNAELEKESIQKDVDTLSKQTEVLSKQIEAQQGIEDIQIKFRESQQAKYVWLYGSIGGLGSALIAAVVALFRRPKSR
jgi:hypothetical protein